MGLQKMKHAKSEYLPMTKKKATGWGKASCLCLLQQGGPHWRGGSLGALVMCGFSYFQKGEKIYKFSKLKERVKATQP